MIESDVSIYVIAAYCVSAMLIIGLVLVVMFRANYWAERVRDLDRKP